MKGRILVLLVLLFSGYFTNAQCDLNIDQSKTDYFVCLGEAVQFETTVLGGVPPYSYSWSPSNGLSNNSVANPICRQEGTYQVKVTDSKGCTVFTNFTYMSYPDFSINFGMDRQICRGDTIRLDQHNVSIYKGSWTPSTGIIDRSISSPILVPDQTTSYIINAEDENNCKSSDTIKITVNELPLINIPQNSITISKGEEIQLDGITVSGGKPPYAYNWGNSEIVLSLEDPNNYIINPVLSPEKTSDFIFQVYDDNKCMSESRINIRVK